MLPISSMDWTQHRDLGMGKASWSWAKPPTRGVVGAQHLLVPHHPIMRLLLTVPLLCSEIKRHPAH